MTSESLSPVKRFVPVYILHLLETDGSLTLLAFNTLSVLDVLDRPTKVLKDQEGVFAAMGKRQDAGTSLDSSHL